MIISESGKGVRVKRWEVSSFEEKYCFGASPSLGKKEGVFKTKLEAEKKAKEIDRKDLRVYVCWY